MDLPSGLDGDRGEPHAGAVTADLTLTVGVPKAGLVADDATHHVGRLVVIPLAELPIPPDGDRLIVPGELAPLLPPRSFDMHKGDAGRVGIVGGSRGFLGAAILTACGALRGGAGLVTLFIPEDLYPLVVSHGPPPELMVRPVESYADVRDHPLDVLAMGPGLGSVKKKRRLKLLGLLDNFAGPVVLDADGLNLVAAADAVDRLGSNVLVTPHPGEMDRLLPDHDDANRAATARRFVRDHRPVLLFKGARTIVTAPGEALHYNPTGTPGMATGGQGDVLTGLLAALMAQGLAPFDAARCGAWLAGRASELALATGRDSVQSLTATSTAAMIGAAFRDLQGRP
ncbi:MAG: NAD(P)H-hydrate dehydratase [Akkermansiaceae bacterium]|nr:NAD(P)H-hydrate dehydratase [Akkermansiaceae bacterium]